ncbi:hypothetical protein GlitD10_0940 [Gloeomargarita lithophora Alchichica-D10]|uniref:SPOR domain-containing protein n=1 Tax=Gloeomargarita lithophora Alchichica-D10 TaxID=1188229 RepID=A0A1J0ABE4_9CYAN|nr:SPOR domain-containing protein [Gloeomargarita lithophora]APB33258.1 hypothetical protein GlitD10_0940 [Gloeomargarita lithophora Alchichica-D10]
MAIVLEQTTLMGALACLDIDLEQELHQLQMERANWEPGFVLSLLGSKPTPPPEMAWTFPPAASADEPLEPTEVVTEPEAPVLLAVPELDVTVAFVPPADPALEAELATEAELTGTLAFLNTGEDETTDEVAALLSDELAVQPPAPEVPALSPRPSWSERLNRVFTRRQALAPAGALVVPEEAVGDPWAETFPEPHQRPLPQRGLQHPVLGFAIGVTAATLGTLGVLFILNQQRPTQTTTPQLTVPAPPPESAVVPPPNLAPVPNLARKELPDLSAIPTASPIAVPSTSPGVSPDPGFFYVVLDYQNEQSLLSAQKMVPEAFVWQFSSGVKVQLAAFEGREQAEQFVADLKAKGMTARVYP